MWTEAALIRYPKTTPNSNFLRESDQVFLETQGLPVEAPLWIGPTFKPQPLELVIAPGPTGQYIFLDTCFGTELRIIGYIDWVPYRGDNSFFCVDAKRGTIILAETSLRVHVNSSLRQFVESLDAYRQFSELWERAWDEDDSAERQRELLVRFRRQLAAINPAVFRTSTSYWYSTILSAELEL
jgi:hypothetical protein